VLARIAARVQRLLRRRGRDPWEADGVQADPLVDESPSPCSEAPVASGSAQRHWVWAALMRRAFDVDVLAYPRCGGRPRLIATVEDLEATGAILAAAQAPNRAASPGA